MLLDKLQKFCVISLTQGGCHADNSVDMQEFMLVPNGNKCFTERLRIGAEIYHTLKKILNEKGLSTGVGDEGGFAPNLSNAEEVLTILAEAVTRAGYHVGIDVSFALDAAASELYDTAKGKYVFPGESAMKGCPVERTAEELIEYYEKLVTEFPIFSIEDGLSEEDWDGWKKLTDRLGEKVLLVGDDLFVTNPKRLTEGMKRGAANAILVKVNQIGTLTEALETIEMAQQAGYQIIISHRSGETEDSFIADLAVACGAQMIKTGAPCRSERVAKYNQLLRIEEHL